MHHRSRFLLLCPITLVCLGQAGFAGELRFEISFPKEARAEPVTGRVYAILSRDGNSPPLRQVSPTGVPFFGKNVADLAPEEAASIGAEVMGFPVRSSNDIPSGGPDPPESPALPGTKPP